uniref:Right handed beta helix domain-containing protein n=1 Tax=Amphimedon queenslandica TaxID=400682 RepID=A0A1X7VD16_AMPQE
MPDPAAAYGNINSNKLRFRSGLIIKNTPHVLINHIVVTKSDGYGAALLNNYKEITVINSKFTWNILSESFVDHTIGGSGMIILVSKCDIENESICTKSTLTDHTCYEISFVSFEYNYYNKPKKVLKWMLLYGGGLNVLLSNKSIGQAIKITRSKFSKNIVVAGGGGLGLTLCEGATGNQVLIHACNFSGNFAKFSDLGGGGGGLKLGLFTIKSEKSGYNNITFNICRFIGNKAIYGGGAAIKIGGTAKNLKNKTVLLFKNSFWYYNEGIFSAAMDISQQIQQLMTTTFCSIPEFESCQFTGNLIFDKGKPNNISLYQGKATFLITKVQVQFKGDTSFLGNDQTALSIVSANIFIKDSSTMTFIHNRGNEVGGISTAGFSVIQYGDNVIFNFTNNHGRTPRSSGAIHAKSFDPHIFISSHVCFLQSFKGKAKNVTFYFFNNGPSIFVTGLHPYRYACTNNEDTVFPPICIIHSMIMLIIVLDNFISII